MWQPRSGESTTKDKLLTYQVCDRAGQEGPIGDVEVPVLAIDLPPGRRLGELSRDDVETVTTAEGRRAIRCPQRSQRQ